MINLFFCHGWGYTSQIFEKLAQNLSKDFAVQNIDLGFFNNANVSTTDIAININHYNVWISHSYGLMFGKLNYDNYISQYIAINPVLSFDKFETAIKAMLYSIQKDKIILTLNQFYQLCKDKNPPQLQSKNINFNKDLLISALKDMLNFDKKLWISSKSMHFLHGMQDIFCQNTMDFEEKIFHKTIIGGHLLPKYNSSQVESFIRKTLFDTCY